MAYVLLASAVGAVAVSAWGSVAARRYRDGSRERLAALLRWDLGAVALVVAGGAAAVLVGTQIPA